MTPLRKFHREALFILAASVLLLVVATAFVVWPFTPMTTLAIIAAVVRGGLLLLTGTAIVFVPMSYWQRFGLGAATAGMFMTTQSLLNPHTPWEAWASIVSGSGWLIYALASFGPTLWERIARIGDK